MKTVKLIRLYYPFLSIRSTDAAFEKVSGFHLQHEAQRFLIIDMSGYSIYYRRCKITKLFPPKSISRYF